MMMLIIRVNSNTNNVIGATGIISKSLRKYLSNITGKHKIKEVQTTAVLGTAHTAESVKVTFNIIHDITCATYCNYRIAATLYTLET